MHHLGIYLERLSKTQKYIRIAIIPLENRTAFNPNTFLSKDCSVNIAMDCWPGGQYSIPGRHKNFPYFKVSRPFLGSTQPPIQ
jgi:hypothetical protein